MTAGSSDRPKVFLLLTACLLALCFAQTLSVGASGATGRQNKKQEKKDGKVHLVHADVMHYDQRINAEATILNGNVAFTHDGAKLFCDSAYFYEASNSFEAFGHVKMLQGDTLSLTSDYAYYDGDAQMAEARFNVVLIHRNSTLYTDSLNYDRIYNKGYFFEGGKLVDKESTLVSDWGEYYSDTRKAVFYYHVKLTNEKFELTTDTLHYDTNTSISHIVGPTDIYEDKTHIYSERGIYDSKNDQSQLMDRSVIYNEGKIIVGDSLFHDSKTGVSEGFWNVIYTDTVNKNRLTGNYCYNNDSTGYAMATDSAVAIDFSQKDTFFVHADTFKVFTYNMNTDSVYRIVHGFNKVRAWRTDVQGVCDSMVYNSQDSCLTMYKDPILWNMNQQVLGEVIKAYNNDSTLEWTHVIGQALTVEEMNDKKHFNQVSSKEMKVFFENGEPRESHAIDNVLVIYYPIDDSDSSIIGMNYTETSLLKMYIKDRQMQKIWMPKANGTIYPLTQVPKGQDKLPTFAWFDYVRPLDKHDIFNYRPKKAGTELKVNDRRGAPRTRINKKTAEGEEQKAEQTTPAEGEEQKAEQTSE